MGSGDNTTPDPILLKGIQSVPKFNRSSPDVVRIYMALFRVESKNVDLVVTFNVPIQTQDGIAVDAAGQTRAEADFTSFVESLVIINYDLFA